jgi:hypothetical protein
LYLTVVKEKRKQTCFGHSIKAKQEEEEEENYCAMKNKKKRKATSDICAQRN